LQSPLQAVAQQTLLPPLLRAQILDSHSAPETQGWPFPLGLATQLPFVHMKPAPQATVRVSHTPLALQVWTRCSVPLAHMGEPQVDPTGSRRQPPFPSQPSEQAPARQALAGSAPRAGTFTQLPSWPATAQDLQLAVQGPAQQRPWAQMLVMHSLPLVHRAPLGFLPQLLAVQTLPGEHWASLAQLPRQALPVHPRKGAQLRAAGTRQVPPMQTPAAVWVLAVASHLGCEHGVASLYLWQPPLPSQRPSVPQVLVAWTTQILAGSFSPLAAR
jgi:hypothetical protein